MQARKAHSLIGRVYDRRNLGLAWERVKKKKGAGGVDPSLSTSDETLTIEELMTLRARTENAGDAGDEHEWSWGR